MPNNRDEWPILLLLCVAMLGMCGLIVYLYFSFVYHNSHLLFNVVPLVFLVKTKKSKFFHYLVVVILLAFSANQVFSQSLSSYEKPQLEELRIENGRLYQGEKEFSQIGFNKFDLWMQYLDQGWEHPRGQGKLDAKEAVKELCDHNFGLIRTMSPFYAAWYEEVFFDENPEVQKQKRHDFFEATDEMLYDANSCGIYVVISIMWNIEVLADLGHHSLHDGLTHDGLAHNGIIVKESLGHRRFKEIAQAIAGRYRGWPGVIIEIGNEYDLFADLQQTNGVLNIKDGMDCPEPNERNEVICAGDHLSPGVIVRDGRNNFTSDELVMFFSEITKFIKDIDPSRLITSGNYGPRQSAMHLFRSAKSGAKVDWSHDNLDERNDYIKMMQEGSGIDIMQVHSYGDKNLAWYQAVARELGVPLMIGELGPDGSSGDNTYTSAVNLAYMGRIFGIIKENGIQIVAIWAFKDQRLSHKGEKDFRICYGETDQFLNLAEQANKNMQTKRRQK